jgi:hypothetical protein
MAVLTLQTITTAGIKPTYAAAGTSNTFPNNGKTFVVVVNGSAGARSIVFDSLVNCDQGSDHNITVSVPAGETWHIGPFEISRFNNSTGLVTFTVDTAANVTLAAISL